MDMPTPNPDILRRKASVLRRLLQVLPEGAVIHDPSETRVYECDALTAYKCPPMLAVLPSTPHPFERVAMDRLAGLLHDFFGA